MSIYIVLKEAKRFRSRQRSERFRLKAFRIYTLLLNNFPDVTHCLHYTRDLYIPIPFALIFLVSDELVFDYLDEETYFCVRNDSGHVGFLSIKYIINIRREILFSPLHERIRSQNVCLSYAHICTHA